MDRNGAVAAIDCGTNSTRLLIVDGSGATLDRRMRITRLGAGVDASGSLAPASIERCLSVLREFRQIMDEFSVVRGRLVATSAARDAANGPAFIESAGEVTGIEPELLEGTEEGQLSMAGALSDLHGEEGPFLILDIGGGSTELVAGTDPHDPELSVVSLQVGCVRISERILTSDPPTAEQLDEGEAMVNELLDQAVTDHPRFLAAHRLVGLAGTVTTLASLQLGLDRYDRDRVHHAVLGAGEVYDWYRTLAAEVTSARLDRVGMVPGREDVIVGGALILAAVMTRFGFDECLVSEADILDGMAAGLVG